MWPAAAEIIIVLDNNRYLLCIVVKSPLDVNLSYQYSTLGSTTST